MGFPRVPVLDEPIDGTSYASREGERFFSVSDLDTGHDVMKYVERFDGVKIYLATNVGSTKSTVLARMSNGKPLVLERKVGEGKVLVFTSDFGAANNDMPRHYSWVPFVQKSMAYLGGAGSGEQPTNLSVGEYVELRTGNEKGAQAEVQDPDGQRVLSLEEAAQARNFELTREGFYEVRTAGGKRQPDRGARQSEGIRPRGYPTGNTGSLEGHRIERTSRRIRAGNRRRSQHHARGPFRPIFCCYC